MNHWPTFEPFESAGERGGLLALWPSVTAGEEPETIEAALSVEAAAPVAATAQSPSSPAVDPIGEATRPAAARTARFSPLLLLGSLAVHAAAIVLAANFLTQPGVDAETDAISVEIVVDATPNPNTDPSLAGRATEKAEQPAPADEKQPEMAKPAADAAPHAISEARTADHAAVMVPPPALTLPATPPAVEAPEVLATPQAAEIQVPQPSLVLPETPPKVEGEQAVSMTLETVTEAVPAPALKLTDAPPPMVEDAEPPLALPDEAPLPTPAPEKTNAAAEAQAMVPTRESAETVRKKRETKPVARAKPGEPVPARAMKQDHRAADRSSSAGVGNAPGRGSVASRGGASAGEKAAYAARLNSHVQRFERYPAEAERNGITGSARILITIDRGGRLISSRLAGSSGSAILDGAAKATASRASPYPPPPNGIGGRTLTFAATIRFRR
jgi:protein TonB